MAYARLCMCAWCVYALRLMVLRGDSLELITVTLCTLSYVDNSKHPPPDAGLSPPVVSGGLSVTLQRRRDERKDFSPIGRLV
ncbi:hypothetical protein EVAR_34506_1 [Eumeta japonica]|uniref:Secreted protein n=1 Tax=Eumeta variegata TaxID=151549 RepID=A0A4C1Z6A3_EUMVA|nr:hypothetical protein EVAR_34506_1 [Eumeta japonica]